jgi:P-type Cu+ transporter
MDAAELGALAGAAGATALLLWFFFGPKTGRGTEMRGGVQEITVVVKGGYSPDRIRVHQGVPLRLVFDRQESGECTARVVFPDFAVSKSLPAFTTTTVDLMPDRAGEFGFACGMNMVHGTLVVEPDGDAPADSSQAAHTDGHAVHEAALATSAHEVEDAEAASRRAEIRDLTRRVLFGAILTAPWRSRRWPSTSSMPPGSPSS